MNPDPMLVLGIVLTAGLLARCILTVHAENKRLSANEKLARECMRDAMKNRDEVVAELHEERRRAYEMQLELDSYRETERRYEEFQRLMGRQMAN